MHIALNLEISNDVLNTTLNKQNLALFQIIIRDWQIKCSGSFESGRKQFKRRLSDGPRSLRQPNNKVRFHKCVFPKRSKICKWVRGEIKKTPMLERKENIEKPKAVVTMRKLWSVIQYIFTKFHLQYTRGSNQKFCNGSQRQKVILRFMPGLVTHICKPSTQQAEAGGSL